MQIRNAEKYINYLIETMCNNGIISEPKDAVKLFDNNKLHKNESGEIVGWMISAKEIEFWETAFLDVDEYAEFRQYKKIVDITTFSYHFQPKDNDELMEYRVDKDHEEVHANPAAESNLNDHLSPTELKLDINSFNLLISIFVAIKYINFENKYPLHDQNAELYNSIIEGQEGNY
jgi:hypothetical protein